MRENWANLPHSIMQTIIKHLPIVDCKSLLYVCKSWRSAALSSRRTSQNLNINLRKYCDSDHSEIDYWFFVNCESLFRTQVITIEFSSYCLGCLDNISSIIYLCGTHNHRGLVGLTLKPSMSAINWQWNYDYEYESLFQKVCSSILLLVTRSPQLRHLSLGLTDGFDGWQNRLLEMLRTYQSSSLTSLHIASLRSDPINSNIPYIDTSLLRSFGLSRLSLDLDHVSEDLIMWLSYAESDSLRELNLFVHDLKPYASALRIRSTCWTNLSRCQPLCQVTVNMVHTGSVSDLYRHLLPHGMPLAKLRLYFCYDWDVDMINYLSTSFSDTLTSLQIIDGFDPSGVPSMYKASNDLSPDPFVMLAWRCTKLCEFVLYGYWISFGDLCALASLRSGNSLHIEVPERCILMDDDEFASEEDFDPYTFMSNLLNYNWEPIADEDLFDGLFNDKYGTEELYIESLLEEQEFKNVVPPQTADGLEVF